MEERYALRMSNIFVERAGSKVLSFPKLEVLENENIAVIRPNGSGKSSLLLAAALLIPSREGQIEYFGQRVSRTNRRKFRRMASISFQNPTLLDRPIGDNVKLAMRLRGFDKEAAARESNLWLERLGADQISKKKPHQLSGGEMQRASLARSFSLAPKLLFLDEPFGAIDPVDKVSISRALRESLQETKAASIIVTHDVGEAAVLASKLAILVDGVITQFGTIGEVLLKPNSSTVATLVGHNVFPIEDFVKAFRFFPPSDIEEYQAVSLPSHAIHATRDPNGRAVIVRYEATTAGMNVVLAFSGIELSVVTSPDSVGIGQWAIGQRIAIELEPNKIVWLAK